MKMTRRLVMAGLLAAAPAWALAQQQAASNYPNRAVRIVVPFTPGGTTDILGRAIAQELSKSLGQSFVVENTPGAGGSIGADKVAKAAPDGYTLMMGHIGTLAVNPSLYPKLPYNPVKDFAPVAGFATFVNAFAVSGANPAKTFNEYVNWVKAQQGKGAVGIPAPASTPEFLVKVMGEKFKLDLVAAPYRGSAPMMADMLGNQIAAGVGSVPDFIENHKAGKVRVLAVLGGARQAALPDVPTFTEIGLAGLEDMPYYGVFAPAGTPKGFIDHFSAAVAKVIALPEVRNQLTQMGLTVGHMSPDQLARRERAYAQVWTRIVRESGFQPQ